jgi:hypothetical protein
MWSLSGGPVHDFLSAATLGGLFGGVINALPLTFEGKENGASHVARLDGLHALDALREQRRHTRVSLSHSRDVKARLREQDAERRAASVPSPRG